MRPVTLLISAMALSASAFAVVGTTSTTTVPGADIAWSWVGLVNGGVSGVAIGPRTILTAKHVGLAAGGTFQLGAQVFTVQNVVNGPNVHGIDTDLTLANLTTTLPGFYNIATSAAAGSNLTMVGYGGSGIVNGSGNGYTITVGAGTRRAAGNVLDGTVDVGGIGPSHYAYLDGAGEAALVGGDSGGGWFNSSGQLIGINSFYFNDTDWTVLPQGAPPAPAGYQDYGFPNANTSGYHYHSGAPWNIDVDLNPGERYFGSGAVDVTSLEVRNWIQANAVPEPTTMVALGLGAIAVLRKRRR